MHCIEYNTASTRMYLVDKVSLSASTDTELSPITGGHFDVADVPQNLPPWGSSTTIGEYHLYGIHIINIWV